MALGLSLDYGHLRLFCGNLDRYPAAFRCRLYGRLEIDGLCLLCLLDNGILVRPVISGWLRLVPDRHQRLPGQPEAKVDANAYRLMFFRLVPGYVDLSDHYGR